MVEISNIGRCNGATGDNSYADCEQSQNEHGPVTGIFIIIKSSLWFENHHFQCRPILVVRSSAR
jgi:hypothetical protein